MLHHLLKLLSEHQAWITCVNPKTLVKKFGSFAQGNPNTGDRRVVFKACLEDVAGVTCFDARTFLEQVLWMAIEAQSD